ncbi:Gfo/Idh/MocA family protein [Cerasicoccus frondis]|uniref:Gfo/Idh/MocA family protein n=1 Tax=Cerasicoccus frondis TaxID=490090 RepID=UPI002852AECA|nr:Gfo/Idh/MocA family oxidoreductase [Cerasicoccus frondis]
MSQVRYGLIGAGQIAYHAANQINNHDDATVIAATDLSAERLKKLCEEKEIPSSYATADELLANPDVDAVYIAVPNKFHAPLAIQSLEAGKHVILEKPFVMNAEEGEAVISAAQRSGKQFTVGMNQRFAENHQKIISLQRQGVFGEIYHAKAFWNRRTGIPGMGTWFGNKLLAGGGCLNDIGVHYLDLCLYAINRFDPVSVYGATYTKFGNRGLGAGGWGISDKTESVFDVDDFASALIRFADGSTVSLDASWACHQETPNRNGVQLYGTDAGADVAAAKVFRNDPLRDDYDVIENVKTDLLHPHCCRFANFTNAILGREALATPPAQSLVVQKILDAIQESSATGREVIL